jgi:geranylgeranyl pyrophosphate synthase
MEKKLNKTGRDINKFLKNFLKKQKRTELITSMNYGLFPGGKKIRSKIIIDVGKIFSVPYHHLVRVGAAVECIHAYSLIHDDLPCMDNDDLRRGKLSTHKKFGESTAVLAGNSLLTLAFEILSEKNFKINETKKNELINSLSNTSGHLGIAGGQYLDLNFEKKRVSKKKIIDMQLNKTGKLFSFSTIAPLVVANKSTKINQFKKIGLDIGLLFQIVDDFLDYKGNEKKIGKKTGKDKKKGKATLISLLGYKNTVKYSSYLKKKIIFSLSKYNKSNDLIETVEFVVNRKK